jgi:hypothetical protein
MTIALIFAVVGLLVLTAVIYFATAHRGQKGSLDELALALRPVDVDAFRNLIDEQEEEFLHERLPGAEFRSIMRERKLAAMEYIWSAAKNAAILIRLGDAARQDSDPAIAGAAEKLYDNALRLRLYAIQAVPRLFLGMLIPGVRLGPCPIPERYDVMTRQAVTLGCLQYPNRGASA